PVPEAAFRQRPAPQDNGRLRDHRAAAHRREAAYRHDGRHLAQDARDRLMEEVREGVNFSEGTMKRFLGALVIAALALVAAPAWGEKGVTFGYQDMMNPWRYVQQTGELEKATGFKINWRQFGGGGDVIRAMASGDVQLGEVGSTGVATAISQGMDVDLFWI